MILKQEPKITPTTPQKSEKRTLGLLVAIYLVGTGT
jgi:hypothetical protein